MTGDVIAPASSGEAAEPGSGDRAAWATRIAAPAAVAVSLAAAIAAMLTEGQGDLPLHVAAQAMGITWLATLAWRSDRTWASALFVTAASWIALYLAPSVIYLFRADLKPADFPTADTLSLINLSLYALIAGALASRRLSDAPRPSPRPMAVLPAEASTRRLAVVACLGVLGLLAVLLHGGGPLEYLSNLDKTAELNAGAVYLVWLALFMKFATITAVADRWAAGQPAGWARLALALGSIAAIGLIGARGLIVLGLFELVLVHVLIRGPIRVRLLVPAALILGLVLVFGLGSIKRYQSYQTGHPGTTVTLLEYLRDIAPGETLAAYANNYADSVALTGRARSLVPEEAPYEHGLALVRLAVKPIPRALRPDVDTSPAIRSAFYSEGGGVLAVPLQAQSYLQFGLAGVALTFVVLGGLLTRLDRWAAAQRPRSLRSVLVAAAGISHVPVLLRGGVPEGLSFVLIEVIGFWIVVTATRRRSATKVA